MLGFFSWVRQSVKAAVIGGFNDAVAEINGADQPVEAEVLRLEWKPEEEPVRTNGRRAVKG